jgi:hypothetical protein
MKQPRSNSRVNTEVPAEAIVTDPSKRDRSEALNLERAEAVEDAVERKESTASPTDAISSAVDRAAEALEGSVQGRVPDGDFVGRTVKTIVYGRNGGAIAQVGDIISQDQIERARSEGVLRDLFEATTTSSVL